MQLGTLVRFTQILTREHVFVPEENGSKANQQQWISKDQEGAGILIGFRTKMNGYTSTENEYDEGYLTSSYRMWNPTKYVRCAIVVTSLYKNPVVVPLNALEKTTMLPTHACPKCFHPHEYRDTTLLDFLEAEEADIEQFLVAEGKDMDGWFFNGKTADGFGNTPREAIQAAMLQKDVHDHTTVKQVQGHPNIWECTQDTKTADQEFVVGFYFSDETGYLNGHYPTFEEADQALLSYVSHMHLETLPKPVLLPLKQLTP